MRAENWNDDVWTDCDAVEDLKPLNSTKRHLPVEATFMLFSEKVASPCLKTYNCLQ